MKNPRLGRGIFILETNFDTLREKALTTGPEWAKLKTIWAVTTETMQILTTRLAGLRPYGQPGQLPKATEMLPLLIELKAQFYKLVTL